MRVVLVAAEALKEACVIVACEGCRIADGRSGRSGTEPTEPGDFPEDREDSRLRLGFCESSGFATVCVLMGLFPPERSHD